MKAPYFVELLSRGGDVLQRQRFDALPIRLGRGYDNDVILDDAHAGAHHAVIETNEDGAPVLRDLGSRNGTISDGKRQASVALDGDAVVRLGHTRVRVRGADFAVTPELADTTMHGWEGAAPALVGLLLIGLFAGLENWLADIDAFQPIRYLLVVVSGLGVGLAWSGGWALANRLFGPHARLGRHLFILGAGLFAAGAWRVLSDVLAFAFSAEWLTRYGNVATIALVCGMLFFHLWTIKPHYPRRFAVSCAILLLAGIGLNLMTNVQSTGRAADELYMSVLLPPALRQSPDHSVAEFMAGAARLKADADAARTRASKDDEEDEEEEGDAGGE
ncbi:MAG TPA: FHA domain-containing protein [Burkholderiaceae bacterium]|nr:FHA domain-containing protein [Burkholderiaceae bacterium]